MSLVNKIVEKYGLDQKLILVPVTCVSTVPLTVKIAGGDDPISARQIAGFSPFSPGQSGMALWSPPLPPICFKTDT
jgi:hypothetical protein